jgi:hypothetical protein
MPINLKYSDLQTFGQISAEQLSITGEYTLPTVDGTANQILSTDGAGTVQFTDLSNLQIVTATNILNGTGINWTIVGLNVVQGDVTLAPFSTTDLAEGTNLYFTNERVDDRISNLIQPGITGSSATVPLTWIYNDFANTLTPQVSISAFTTDNLPQGSSNLYFSGELVDDRVALLLKPAITGTNPTNPIVWNYVDGLDSLTPQVSLAPFNTDALSEGASNLYFTDDRAIDAVGGALVNSATVTWNFNSILNTIEATAVTGISGMAIKLDGGLVGTQPTLEFLTGTNVILSAGNDIINNKVTLQIDSTIGGNLEDLNDVFFLSPGPQFEDILYYNGAAWTSTDLESILPPNYEPISYSSLKTLALASGLIPGRKYLINDYATIYNIPGTSPQVEATGSVEPLVVTAISIDELSPIAFSPSNPDDIIHYDLNPTVGFRNSTINSKGVIYYREDTVNRNIYPADFREIVCRRWDDGLGFYEVITENGNSYIDNPIFGTTCFDNIVDATDTLVLQLAYSINDDLPNIYLLANSIENRFSATSYGITFSNTNASLCKFEGPTINTVFRNGVSIFTNKGSVVNTIFKGAVNSTTVIYESNATGIFSTTFENNVVDCEFKTVSACTFSAAVYNFKGDIITNSTFSSTVQRVDVKVISSSTFTGSVVNLAGTGIDSCTFAAAVNGLYFNFLSFVDFQDVSNCTINNFQNVSSLAVGVNFNNNVLEGDFLENTIGDNFQGNRIGHGFNNNTIGDNFQGNLIGIDFNGNTIGNNFLSNSIGNAFSSNTLGADFKYNKIGNSFNNNTNGSVFSYNVIEDDFESNAIGDGFSKNKISTNFNLNTVSSNFRYNIVEADLGSTDFSSATHVYGAYSCRIVLDSDTNYYLEYFLVGGTAIVSATA